MYQELLSELVTAQQALADFIADAKILMLLNKRQNPIARVTA